ncbi:MAG TPA: YihY/virulence factor BrkB family protein [Acidimicrobiia bacterium]|jgi:YihY family inner membrane protein|nr:YihY/virulence factor BrkB family protein [Acidimicrobiia bacterium]
MNPAERVVRRVDAFQQHHRVPGFLFGVVKKFGDDRAGSLAALIAYYSFLAVFPLLLLLVTILGFVAQNNPDFRDRLVDSTLADFPIIGDQIARNVGSLRATGLGLVISLIGLAWGSLGFTQAGQHAMAEVWSVRGVDRPGFFPRLARGASIIGVLGLGAIVTTIFSGFGVFNSTVPALRGLSMLLSVVLNVAISLVGFRLLTPRVVPSRDLVPGAVLTGVAWSVLQLIGGYLVSQRLEQTSEIYGLFAIVLGLLFWLSLGAQIGLYAAELNVVLARHLYPRSIVQPPLTEPDRDALRQLAQKEERRPEERVRVDFVDEGADGQDRQERTRAESPPRAPTAPTPEPRQDGQ